jgi:hypothetical protein
VGGRLWSARVVGVGGGEGQLVVAEPDHPPLVGRLEIGQLGHLTDLAGAICFTRVSGGLAVLGRSLPSRIKGVRIDQGRMHAEMRSNHTRLPLIDEEGAGPCGRRLGRVADLGIG